MELQTADARYEKVWHQFLSEFVKQVPVPCVLKCHRSWYVTHLETIRFSDPVIMTVVKETDKAKTASGVWVRPTATLSDFFAIIFGSKGIIT